MLVSMDGAPPPRTQAMAALRRVGRAWTAVAEQLLAEEGTTLAQYAVLYALKPGGGRSGADLARQCGVTGATMSGLITSLADRGLIKRVKDPSGGRAVLARLTPQGKDLLERCYPHVDAVEAQFMAEVSESELRVVEDVLLRWAARFERLQEPQSLSAAMARSVANDVVSPTRRSASAGRKISKKASTRGTRA